MNKEKTSVLSYSHLDNKRLQDAFFSPPKKQPPPKKKKIIFLPIISILLLLLLFLIFNYDFVLIPRSQLSVPRMSQSLFSKDILASVSFIGQDEKLMRAKKSLVYLTIPEKQKVGIKFDFKKPINLNKNQLVFLIKKSKESFNMEVTARDIYFFSNARTPAKIMIDKNDNSSYNKIPVQFQNTASPNVNFAKINQIKVYFDQSSDKNELVSADSAIKFREKDWIIIKDIGLVKKEGDE